MNELANLEVIPQSSRLIRIKVELHGGTANLYNKLSDNTDELVKEFNGSESAVERRFNMEIVEGDSWFFALADGAKAFYR